MAVILQATSATSGDAAWVDSSGYAARIERQEIAILAGGTVNFYFWAPYNMTITRIDVVAITAPVSAAGTYLFTIAGAGNNLLAASNFDLESLVSGTLTSLTLTGTTANLNIDAGGLVQANFVSNNVDLTGEGMHIILYYSSR